MKRNVFLEMKSWSDFSIITAMTGVEDKNEPDYSLEDVIELSYRESQDKEDFIIFCPTDGRR